MSKWKSTTLGEFVDKKEISIQTGPFGTQLKASDYVKTGTPVINVRNIGFGTIIDNNLEYIANDTRDRLSSNILEKCDIVFGRKGAVERHAFIDENHAGWFQGSDCIRVRIKAETLLARFISYFLLTPLHKAWMINNCSHGATMASLNQDIVRRIPIEVPPISTQNKIVSILSTYDDLITNNNLRISILEGIVQDLYREWFIHFRFPGYENVKLVMSEMGMIPEEYKVVKVKDVLDRCKKGKVYAQGETFRNGQVPVIDQSTSYVLGYHNNEPDIFASTVKPVGIFGDHTCKMQLMLHPFSVGPNVIAFTAKEEQELIYIYYSVMNLIETKEYKRHWSDFMTKKLIIAKHNLQKEFSNIALPFLLEVDILNKKNRNLRKTRDLLIPRLISGDIDVSKLDLQ